MENSTQSNTISAINLGYSNTKAGGNKTLQAINPKHNSNAKNNSNQCKSTSKNQHHPTLTQKNPKQQHHSKAHQSHGHNKNDTYLYGISAVVILGVIYSINK